MLKKVEMKQKMFLTGLLMGLLCLLLGLAMGTNVRAAGDEVTLQIKVTEYYDMANEILALVNQERTELGLEPLALDADLQEAAMQRATEAGIYSEHERPNGADIWTAEPSGKIRSENLSGKPLSGGGAAAYNGWKASSKHHDTMLRPYWRAVGIGCISLSDDSSSYVAAMVFGYGENFKPITVSGTKKNTRGVTVKWSECTFGTIWTVKSEGITHLQYKKPGDLYMTVKSAGTFFRKSALSIFNFSSSNPSIFTVTNGQITGYSSGTALLTVTLKADPSYTKTIPFRLEVEKPEPEYDYAYDPSDPAAVGGSKQPEKEAPKESPAAKALTVKVKKASCTYNGKNQKPAVTVYAKGKKLAAKYYTVSYKSNKNVGTARVTVKGKGAYKGYQGTANFRITLKKPGKPTAQSKKKQQLTIKWKKDRQASGYEIQIASNKKMSAGVCSYLVAKKKSSYTVKGLVSKKNCYIRIRTYRNTGDGRVYSKWSAVRPVKVK